MISPPFATPPPRRLLVLSGSRSWCIAAANRLLEATEYRDTLWITDHQASRDKTTTSSGVKRHLGEERDALVIDAWAGFDPDTFGAAVGGVRGGGAVLLLTPPLKEWPDGIDPAMQRLAPWPWKGTELYSRFLQRLVGILTTSSLVQCYNPGHPPPGLPSPPSRPSPSADPICRSNEQRRAVEAILRVVHGHRRRPLVLTADRGRGKSSALGIAAARLLREGAGTILVTAPAKRAVTVLFHHARRGLPDSEESRGELSHQGGRIKFVAPDELIQRPQPADLLLVDEAAAIPAPLLEQLLRQHSRIVFSTTIHGYEGTGRGFAVRFRETLDRLTPQWRALHLTQPIRWPRNDPVEQFTFQALLLNATPADNRTMVGITATACKLAVLTQEQLIANEELLNELFGLLVLAHYRTCPNDLRNLLDTPGVTIHLLLYNSHVAAAAVTIGEGGVNEPLAKEIWLGRRRIHGHLLAQSLAVHAGFPEAAQLRYTRIMRLAVHPAATRRGVGTRLVREILQRNAGTGVDAVGTSFGATSELLDFWRRLEFHSVRLGLRREASSGTNSVLMLHPLTPEGSALQRRLRSHLLLQLPTMLGGPLRELEVGIVLRLLQDLPPPPTGGMSAQEWRDAISFAYGRRGYEVCMEAINKLVFGALANRNVADALHTLDRELLVLRVLQNRGWESVAPRLGFSGRKQGSAALRAALRRLAEIGVAKHHPELAGLHFDDTMIYTVVTKETGCIR